MSIDERVAYRDISLLTRQAHKLGDDGRRRDLYENHMVEADTIECVVDLYCMKIKVQN